MLRKQAVFDRETFLTLPDLPPRLKLWGEDRELEDFLVKKAFMINPIPSSVARADGRGENWPSLVQVLLVLGSADELTRLGFKVTVFGA